MGACRICRNAEGNRVFTARESGFGLNEEFAYLRCAACGCVHLVAIPEDLSPYYPPEYYSFQQVQPPVESKLARYLKLQRTAYVLGGFSPLGWLAALLQGIPEHLRWVRLMGLSRDSRILDVGCGAGELLLHLRSLGFTRLAGIDPLLPGEVDYGPGLRIGRRSLEDEQGEYDLVMLNHVLEHLPDQDGALGQIRRLLPTGGWALIRVPLAGSVAWRQYGAHWAQLDPPRHIYLHTPGSLKLVCERHSFELREVRYDSTAFQFWGSEQARLGVPLYSERSYHVNPAASSFTSAQIAAWEEEARRLNAAGDGDQACFFFQAT